MFGTEDELTKQIKAHQRLAYAFLFLIILSIFTLAFSIVSLIENVYAVLFICLSLFVLSAVMLILIARYCKKEKELSHHPYIVRLPREVSYEAFKHSLSALADPGECRDFPKESAYFCFLKATFENRFLVVNTDYFVRSDFDSIKKNINKKINKDCNVTQWVLRDKAAKLMRVNVIVTRDVNAELYEYLSHNAGDLLRRVEGVINFALVGDGLIVPPVFGDMSVLEVKRYKKSITDIKTLLSSAY